MFATFVYLPLKP